LHLFFKHIALSFGLFLSLISTAQELDKDFIDQLKLQYQDISQPVKAGGKQISFLNADSLKAETGIEIIQVMIIRHQKVNLPRQRNYTFREANRYYQAYDTADIFPVEVSPVKLNGDDVDKIYCSRLPRAINTSRQMFGNDLYLEKHKFFNEFKKDMVPLPVVRFNLDTWSVLSSIEWILGAGNGQGETYKGARARAEYAAEFLEGQAMAEEKVVLVAHGFLNHFIRKYMKKNGWHLIVDGRNRNLGVSLLVKEKVRK
jgi:hypothetical protein